MQRREFIIAMSAAVSTLAIVGCEDKSNGAGMEAGDMSHPMDKLFPRYTEYDPKVPIWNVTPDMDRCIHRFHLSSPFSPSGRYLGLTRLPREDEPPQPGDVAEIVVVDLETGEQKIVAETIGWDTQLGAQVQWGATDEELYFNDINPETWIPFGIKMNHLTGAKQKLDGAIYDVSPDGKWAVTTSLTRIGATQAGYGVIVPKEHIPVNKGLVDDDGVYVTNTETGKVEMIASYKKIVDETKIDVSRYGPGDFYGFHTKWNSKSDRIMLVLRYMPHNDKQRKPMLITMTRTGEDIRVAIPASEWADKGGNHPDWHPDGEHVIMNLESNPTKTKDEKWVYVQAKYDGSDLKKFTTVPANHGHPSIHPGGRYMISDVYPREDDAFGDGTVPLHFVDLEKHERQTLVRLDAVTKYFDEDMVTGKNTAKEMRVDFHPAWDRSNYTRVAINGVIDGTRRVFVVDLSSVLK